MKSKNLWTMISVSISASEKKTAVFASGLFNLFCMVNLFTIIIKNSLSPEPSVL